MREMSILAATLTVMLLCGCGGQQYVTSSGWMKQSQRRSGSASAQHSRVVQSLKKQAGRRGGHTRSYFSRVETASVDTSAQPVQATSARPAPKRPTSKRPPSKRRKARRQTTRKAPPQVSAPKRKARAYRVAAKEEQRTQQVVYLGYLQLRVRQRIKTLDAVTKLVEEANGYIERVGQRTVVVRIPASDFDATMRRFEALGRVTARRIQALDVSAQFTDLDARLAVAGESQRRLLALLAQEQDVNERLRIVKEIKRLSEQIESIESTLGTLRNLVAYYTITLDIIGTAQHRRSADHRSPFPWVRSLVDHRIVHEAGKDTLSLSVAKGFVRFETADSWHARAADTAIVRAAVLPNEPDGSTTFWHAAVAHELSGRSDVAHEQGQSGGVIWTAWRNRDVEPRIWLIGLKVVRGQIALVEAFFPTVASWKRHRAAVIGTLSSLEVR